jgi:hypothetical protein
MSTRNDSKATEILLEAKWRNRGISPWFPEGDQLHRNKHLLPPCHGGAVLVKIVRGAVLVLHQHTQGNESEFILGKCGVIH